MGVAAAVFALVGLSSASADKTDLHLVVGLDIATAYIFNGSNYFMVDSPGDQNAVLAPRVVWRPGGGPVSIGYRGAYQISGPVRDLIELGWGAEQDLWVSVETDLTESLALEGVLYTFFYPFASTERAGATVPFYFMPHAVLTWAGPVTVTTQLAWVHGVQEATRAYRYFYAKPGVDWEVALDERVGLRLAVCAGAKLFYGGAGTDGRFDLGAKVGLPLWLHDRLMLEPSFNVSWQSRDEFPLAEGIVLWGGMSTAWSL